MPFILFEYKCVDCKRVVLLEYEHDPDTCPYCQGDLDYATGKIEPVLEYTPRHERIK